jgi:phosphoenolpyruvate synthase/pyruvate phosphate dikinase
VLTQAVHGLGVALVDGRTSPEVIRVALGAEPPQLTRTPSSQASRFVSLPGSGITEETLAPDAAAKPCISDAEAVQLARWALTLETHFGCPQDLEWAVSPERNLILLQSRPLRVLQYSAAKEPPKPNSTLLLEGGEVACPGVGAGPAVHLDADGDVEAFPAGGVLVARRSSPKFVRLMTKAAAVQFARQGIRVNSLCPGPVETPLLLRIFGGDPAALERRRIHWPMGRLAKPREVVNGALVLASDESSYVNGTSFLVDGGLTAAYVTPE